MIVGAHAPECPCDAYSGLCWWLGVCTRLQQRVLILCGRGVVKVLRVCLWCQSIVLSCDSVSFVQLALRLVYMLPAVDARTAERGERCCHIGTHVPPAVALLGCVHSAQGCSPTPASTEECAGLACVCFSAVGFGPVSVFLAGTCGCLHATPSCCVFWFECVLACSLCHVCHTRHGLPCPVCRMPQQVGYCLICWSVSAAGCARRLCVEMVMQAADQLRLFAGV
jgi:hypothetical protein